MAILTVRVCPNCTYFLLIYEDLVHLFLAFGVDCGPICTYFVRLRLKLFYLFDAVRSQLQFF